MLFRSDTEQPYRIRITEERYQKQTEADGGQEYSSEIEKLHREQYDSLPEDERYTGTESVEGLLEKKASGEILDGREENYLKIFANLHDYERATANGRLRNILFPKIQEALEKAGISGVRMFHVYANSSATSVLQRQLPNGKNITSPLRALRMPHRSRRLRMPVNCACMRY